MQEVQRKHTHMNKNKPHSSVKTNKSFPTRLRIFSSEPSVTSFQFIDCSSGVFSFLTAVLAHCWNRHDFCTYWQEYKETFMISLCVLCRSCARIQETTVTFLHPDKKECVLISTRIQVSAFYIIFYLSARVIQLCTNFTPFGSPLSLFNYPPYRTKSLFRHNKNYINKGQTGWVNICNYQKKTHELWNEMENSLLHIDCIMLNQIGPLYISFNWTNVVLITVCYIDRIFHNTQKQLRMRSR